MCYPYGSTCNCHAFLLLVEEHFCASSLCLDRAVFSLSFTGCDSIVTTVEGALQPSAEDDKNNLQNKNSSNHRRPPPLAPLFSCLSSCSKAEAFFLAAARAARKRLLLHLQAKAALRAAENELVDVDGGARTDHGGVRGKNYNQVTVCDVPRFIYLIKNTQL